MGIAQSIGTLLGFVLELYTWLVILRLLLSWFVQGSYHPVILMLANLTEPVLAPCRRWLPPIAGIDLSPLLAIFGLNLLQGFVHALFSGADGAILSLLVEVLRVVHLLLTFYMLLLSARAGMNIYSWLCFRYRRPARINIHHPLTQFLFRSTDRVLFPMRRWVPTVAGLDISPLVAAVGVMGVLWLIQGSVAMLPMLLGPEPAVPSMGSPLIDPGQ
jgi:YggT family protein